LKKQPFETLLPNAPEEAIDLLNEMVALNPKDRISIAEVAEHPFFSLGDETELSENFVKALKELDEVEKLKNSA
jgi:serine/threonine protein kinase